MTEEKGFKHWFENVFWYHYKWWFLLGVFIIALIVFISLESSRNEHYDLTAVFVQDNDITQEQAMTVLDAISESVGDLDGNGKILLNYASINPGEATSGSVGASMQDRLLLYMTDEDYCLFFLTADQAESYCALGYFEDRLSDYGIETAQDDPFRVYVSDTDAFAAAGLRDGDYYALIIDWTTVGKGSQENTDAAVRAIQALLNGD